MMTRFMRRTDVVERVEGDETLVLDTRSETAHCLSGDVARVWHASESATTVAAVVETTGLELDAVETALESLHALDLVAITSGGLDRRKLLLRGAAVGGAVVAAGVVSIPLPASARATSVTIGVTSACQAVATNTGGYQPTKLTITLSGGKLQPNTTYTYTIRYYSGNGSQGRHLETAIFHGLTNSTATSISLTGSTTDAVSPSFSGTTATVTTMYTFHEGVDLTISAGGGDTQTVSLTGLTHCVPHPMRDLSPARSCVTSGTHNHQGRITLDSPGSSDATGLIVNATYNITISWTGGSTTPKSATFQATTSGSAQFDSATFVSGSGSVSESGGTITYYTATNAWSTASGTITITAADLSGNIVVNQTLNSQTCS